MTWQPNARDASLADDSGSNGAPSWTTLLSIAGGLGGFAALIYLIGVIPYWIRLASLGFPTDVVVHVATQEQIVQQGLNPTFIWVAITVAGATVVWVSQLETRSVQQRLRAGAQMLGMSTLCRRLGRKPRVARIGEGGPRPENPRRMSRPILGALSVLVVGSGFTTATPGQRSRTRRPRDPTATNRRCRDVAATSVADELSKLAKLRDDGILSEIELTSPKARLIGLSGQGVLGRERTTSPI